MYPFYSVYEHEQTLYTFHHNDLTNYQWYEKCSKWSDITNSIRVNRKHKVLLEHVAHEKHSDYLGKSQEKNQKQ